MTHRVQLWNCYLGDFNNASGNDDDDQWRRSVINLGGGSRPEVTALPPSISLFSFPLVDSVTDDDDDDVYSDCLVYTVIGVHVLGSGR